MTYIANLNDITLYRECNVGPEEGGTPLVTKHAYDKVGTLSVTTKP